MTGCKYGAWLQVVLVDLGGGNAENGTLERGNDHKFLPLVDDPAFGLAGPH
jgi:hypothetical protein